MKPSKQKQKLYDKFLKFRTNENELVYKAYKNLFETIRKNQKEPITPNYLQNIKMI